MNLLSALGFPRFPYSRGAREHCLCSIIPGMSSDKFASASRSFSLSTQLEATETSGSDSDIPLAKMADSEALLADARQRVANLEKEERLLKLRKEKDQVDSMARKLKEEVERAEKAVRKEKSNGDRLLDPGTPEPARKKPRLDGPPLPQAAETSVNVHHKRDDITGYDELEDLRIGPCNSCRENDIECIRSRRATKTGSVEVGRCISCKTHHHSCVWGVGGYIRFRPRQSIADSKEPKKRAPPKAKPIVKEPMVVVEKATNVNSVQSSNKAGKPPALEIETIRNEMVDMHRKTMAALEDLSRRILVLEAQKGAATGGSPDK